jgi:hypothetical protein
LRYAAHSDGSGYEKPQSGYALCGVFSPPHCQPPQTYGLLYKGAVNVVYLCTLSDIFFANLLSQVPSVAPEIFNN